MNLSDTGEKSPAEMPHDVREAFLKILYCSFLSIRSNSKAPELCYAFSDHAHNIPGLISNFSLGAFRYYWECERPCFAEKLKKLNHPFGLFNEHWATLENYYQSLK